ncbi:MAG: phage protein Gp27 family protein, partial [Spirochaetota bacterium]
MSQRSGLECLPESLRELIRRLWGEGATIDELTEFLRSQLGEDAPARSSVGRYAKRLKEAQQEAHDRNAYLREVLKTMPPESRDNLTVVTSESLKYRILTLSTSLNRCRIYGWTSRINMPLCSVVWERLCKPT